MLLFVVQPQDGSERSNLSRLNVILFFFFSLGFQSLLVRMYFQVHCTYMVDTVLQEPQDPFSLVSDELSLIADRLRAMVVAKVFSSPWLLTK